MGNRLTKVNDGISEGYTYNNANMLLTRGANNYTNDLDGNTLTGGGRTNTWDSENRLVTCVNGGNTSNFTYASDGLRHRSVLGANTTDFILDASFFVREKLNGVVSATYLIGARGPEYRRDDVSGQIRWYVFDGLGSVLGECDPNGNLTATRSFDVYGAVRTSAGTSTSKHKFVGNLGHPSEDETGLVYMQARYMDPIVGRFSSGDVHRSGRNWFIYCGNSPSNHVDPDGKDSVIPLEIWDCLVRLLGPELTDIIRTSLVRATMDFLVASLRGAAAFCLAMAEDCLVAAQGMNVARKKYPINSAPYIELTVDIAAVLAGGDAWADRAYNLKLAADALDGWRPGDPLPW